MKHWKPSDKIVEKAFRYVEKHIRKMGYPPTLREIGKALGYTSPSSGTAIVEEMENRGWIKRSQDRRRVIVVTRGEEK